MVLTVRTHLSQINSTNNSAELSPHPRPFSQWEKGEQHGFPADDESKWHVSNTPRAAAEFLFGGSNFGWHRDILRLSCLNNSWVRFGAIFRRGCGLASPGLGRS